MNLWSNPKANFVVPDSSTTTDIQNYVMPLDQPILFIELFKWIFRLTNVSPQLAILDGTLMYPPRPVPMHCPSCDHLFDQHFYSLHINLRLCSGILTLGYQAMLTVKMSIVDLLSPHYAFLGANFRGLYTYARTQRGNELELSFVQRYLFLSTNDSAKISCKINLYTVDKTQRLCHFREIIFPFTSKLLRVSLKSSHPETMTILIRYTIRIDDYEDDILDDDDSNEE